jgi:type I restriction enzyme, S subunit
VIVARSDWKPHRLDELGFVGRGKSRHRPRNDARLYGGPYPFIQTADVMNADPYITDYSQTYTEFGLQQSKLWPANTLCMTIAGANTAKTAILKFEACFPDSIVGFIPDEKKADLHFVKYSLDVMKHKFLAVTRGATQDNLSLDKLLSFPIPTPPLPVQRRIANIVSAYDDLIENNQRRIRILEEIARSLYREWFVNFRYLGHEKVPFVDSPLGPIPKGWEVKKLAEIAENFDRLRKPLSKIQRAEVQGDYPYYGAAKVFDYINDYIFDGEYLLIAEDGSVITVDRAPVLQLVNERFWPNNHTHVLRGKGPFSTHFLYLGLSLLDISPYITGAAQPKITQENMNRIPFFCGPQALHFEFDRMIAPMIHQSQVLQRQTAILERTRDLVLPKFLSGELPVNIVETSPEQAPVIAEAF